MGNQKLYDALGSPGDDHVQELALLVALGFEVRKTLKGWKYRGVGQRYWYSPPRALSSVDDCVSLLKNLFPDWKWEFDCRSGRECTCRLSLDSDLLVVRRVVREVGPTGPRAVARAMLVARNAASFPMLTYDQLERGE